jgi:hypothetical protein
MAQLVNLVIDQGSDFVATLDIEDSIGNALDLGPYNVRGQVRKTYTSLTSTEIACTKTDNQGEVKLVLTNTQTSAMKDGRYVYDIEIVHAILGTVIRVVEGQVTVTPRATRPSE